MTQDEKELEFYKNLQIMKKVYDDIDKNKQTPTELSEQKDKLLKYLCAALPYGVIISITCEGITYDKVLDCDDIKSYKQLSPNSKTVVKPYLRPIELSVVPIYAYTFRNSVAEIEWYLKKHLDFIGLIDEGLAIEVTEENNPYKD